MKNLFVSFLSLLLLISCRNNQEEGFEVSSPDGSIKVNFHLTSAGEPVYSVAHSGSWVLRQSKLGIIRNDGDFSKGMTIESASEISAIIDNYTMLHGKSKNYSYSGNRRVFSLKNASSDKMEIIFQVSNDGVAFRYFFPEQNDTIVKIYRELTSYHLNLSARAFLQPCADARLDWSYASPSYEEHYLTNIPVGTAAPKEAGWVLPALFNDGKFWISITEAAVDTNYCGTRLARFSPDGEYTVQFPQPQEGRFGEPVLPESVLPWQTPWRIIVITDNLGSLVESTLGTDLAIPEKYDVSSWLRPGIASWSWVILKDGATEFNIQKKFIDFAAEMSWEYCLIDAFWDSQIGYEKIRQLADYALSKNVKIILWYNSAGDWNTTPHTPRDKMNSSAARKAEFKRIHEMGIAGIKVDFFGGDGQSMMKYYIDILKDAAAYNIAVNFHGCTFPRGWARTYPNLVSMEAIRGEEYVTFDQYNAEMQPYHCTVIPFTRNLFDPMDFTPVNFSGIPNITRKTTNGFEIALSILFTSGIQHIAETPDGMSRQKDFVKEFMSTLPRTWDEVKFVDGYPGKFVIMARRSGDYWYVAGINGEETSHTVTIDLSFLREAKKGMLLSDSENLSLAERDIDLSGPLDIEMKPFGGFVMKISVEKEGNN